MSAQDRVVAVLMADGAQKLLLAAFLLAFAVRLRGLPAGTL